MKDGNFRNSVARREFLQASLSCVGLRRIWSAGTGDAI